MTATIRELPCGSCLQATPHARAPQQFYGPNAWSCSKCGYTETFTTSSGNNNVRPLAAVPAPPAVVQDTAAKLLVRDAADFAAVDEKGAEAILGDVLIPEGGDVMLYGDGGVGKTTLAIDLACHLAAGDEWLGIPVPKPRRLLLLEAEGPRPLYRLKLRRKLAAWDGSPLGDRLKVWEEPWAAFSFGEEPWRRALAAKVSELEVDMLVIGPLTSVGMDAPGTIPETRAFLTLVDEVRRISGRPVAVLLVHHENRQGKVSGAWEGVGDTLLHAMQQGHGKLRLYVQKARWASALHLTTLQLAWAAGDSFALTEAELARPERTWEGIGEYVLEHGGTGWVQVEKAVPGQGDYLRRRRDAMLDEGLLINAGAGQRFELWHRDDHARPPLDTTVSQGGHGSDTAVSDTGDEGRSPNRVPVSPRKGDTERDTVVPASPGDPESDNDAAGRRREGASR